MINIIELSDSDFKQKVDGSIGKQWYGYPRGFILYDIDEYGNHILGTEKIYINKDAFYFGEEDKQLLIEHEIGHSKGEEHNITGVMSANGPIRYLTTSPIGMLFLGICLIVIVGEVYKCKR